MNPYKKNIRIGIIKVETQFPKTTVATRLIFKIIIINIYNLLLIRMRLGDKKNITWFLSSISRGKLITFFKYFTKFIAINVRLHTARTNPIVVIAF